MLKLILMRLLKILEYMAHICVWLFFFYHTGKRHSSFLASSLFSYGRSLKKKQYFLIGPNFWTITKNKRWLLRMYVCFYTLNDLKLQCLYLWISLMFLKNCLFVCLFNFPIWGVNSGFFSRWTCLEIYLLIVIKLPRVI